MAYILVHRKVGVWVIRGEYKVWEVRIEERTAWRVRSKEKVGLAYVALSVWVQQSGCQKEGENIDKG